MALHYAGMITIAAVASGAINPYRITATSAEGVEEQASAATDPLSGVVVGPTAIADGGRLEVYKDGIRPVEYGATVAAGEKLTADSVGRAIPATTGQESIGIAQEAGGVGTIGSVWIQRALA